MQNPFESGHIKNYLLFYASIVVIVVLFFIASTLFHDVQTQEKKVFDNEVKEKNATKIQEEIQRKEEVSKKFKLLETGY